MPRYLQFYPLPRTSLRLFSWPVKHGESSLYFMPVLTLIVSSLEKATPAADEATFRWSRDCIRSPQGPGVTCRIGMHLQCPLGSPLSRIGPEKVTNKKHTDIRSHLPGAAAAHPSHRSGICTVYRSRRPVHIWVPCSCCGKSYTRFLHAICCYSLYT